MASGIRLTPEASAPDRLTLDCGDAESIAELAVVCWLVADRLSEQIEVLNLGRATNSRVIFAPSILLKSSGNTTLVGKYLS